MCVCVEEEAEEAPVRDVLEGVLEALEVRNPPGVALATFPAFSFVAFFLKKWIYQN